MKSLGSTLLFFGIGTVVLNLVGYEFVILAWVDMWGETVGWLIRGAIFALGGILFLLGGGFGGSEPAAE